MEIAEYLSVQYYNLIQLEQKYSCIEQSSKVVEEKKSDSIWAFFQALHLPISQAILAMVPMYSLLKL